MSKHNWIGILIFSVLFFGSFLVGDGAGMMFNALGLLVVASGTLGATFLSYPFTDIKAAFRVARNSYTAEPPTSQAMVDALMDLSIRSRYNGILSLEDEEEHTSILFLKSALGMMVDGYKQAEFREVLYTEMYFFEQRRLQQERFFRHMARLAPAFGVTGSVIGLVGMLAGIGDTGVIVRTIPIALTSTLYGIVISNFLLTPVAENIYAKTQKELLIQKLIIEGVTAIAEEHNTLRLQTKLESFLTPAARAEGHRGFDEIRAKYEQIRQERLGET